MSKKKESAGIEKFRELVGEEFVPRFAYHEIGHVFAWYVCHGNIDNIAEINIVEAATKKETYMSNLEYVKSIVNFSNDGFNKAFDELCYAIGGGLCEAMFVDNYIEKINKNMDYKFPVNGMEGDMESVGYILSCLGVTDVEEINAFLKVAIRRLFVPFMVNADKILILANMVIKDNKPVLYKEDFFDAFDMNKFKDERMEVMMELGKMLNGNLE